MIYINDGDFKLTPNYSSAGAVIMPFAGRYNNLVDASLPIYDRYKMIPSTLQWFIQQYSCFYKAEEVVDAAACFYNMTPAFNNVSNISKRLLAGHIPRACRAASVNENTIKYKPHIIGVVVAKSLLNYENYGIITNNYVAELAEKRIHDTLRDALAMAVNSVGDKPFNKKIIIAPLFNEKGYRLEDPSAYMEWRSNPSYVKNMLNFLDKYNLDDFDVEVYYRTFEFKNSTVLNLHGN